MAVRARGVFIAAIVAALAAGCSSMSKVSGGEGTISIQYASQPGAHAAARNAATVRLLPYVDERSTGNPRKIGVGGENVYGLYAPKGTDILLDRDAAAVVTSAMKQRLLDAGYRVVSEGDAQFELRGSVKELTYNVKVRDEVAISVATEVKDVATGNILWSGVVNEKKDRFPGVMGDSIADVAAFLKVELGVVTQKTSDAVTAILVAQRPELFNVAPGSKPIPGVTVLSVPAASAVPPAVPAASATGVLAITTKPARAKIYVGGVYYGLSPLRLELEPGIVEVEASLERYKKAGEKVSVRKGETTELELTLTR